MTAVRKKTWNRNGPRSWVSQNHVGPTVALTGSGRCRIRLRECRIEVEYRRSGRTVVVEYDIKLRAEFYGMFADDFREGALQSIGIRLCSGGSAVRARRPKRL